MAKNAAKSAAKSAAKNAAKNAVNNSIAERQLNSVFRSDSGTLALQTEGFSKKIGHFSKTQKWIY